jgi:YVTN family beta-propeller protein
MRHLVLGLMMAFLLVVNQAAASGTAPVAYLSTDAGPNVLAVDTSSSTVQPTSISVGSAGTTTYGVAVGPKGAKVYVTGGQSPGMLYVIDTATRAVTPVTVGDYPRGVAVNHDGSRIYVANALSQSVSVIDGATNTLVATVTGFRGFPWGVAVSAVSNRLYVTNVYGIFSGDEDVKAVDTTTNQIVAGGGVSKLGGLPMGIAVSPDGTRLYVADYGSGPSGRVWAIDPALMGSAGAVVATVTVGPNPFGIVVTPDSKHVYVSNSGGNFPGVITPGENTVSVIDAATVTSGASSPMIAVGKSPQGVSVSSDGSTVFVANWFSGNLTAISVATNTTRTIAPAGVLFPVSFGNFVTPITFITANFEVVPKVINLKAQGTIPVVIYGSQSLDVHTLDLSSLHLNGMTVKIKPNGEPMANYGSYAGSGYDDVMVHFTRDGVQASSGDATVTLTGQTMCSPLPCSGTPIQGTSTVTFIH